MRLTEKLFRKLTSTTAHRVEVLDCTAFRIEQGHVTELGLLFHVKHAELAKPFELLLIAPMGAPVQKFATEVLAAHNVVDDDPDPVAW